MANTLPVASLQSWTELVQGDPATPTPALVAPYRLVSFGDSRAVTVFGATLIGASGSGTGVTMLRTGGWLPAILGDTEIVGNFGVSGDTLVSAGTTTGWNGSIWITCSPRWFSP